MLTWRERWKNDKWLIRKLRHCKKVLFRIVQWITLSVKEENSMSFHTIQPWTSVCKIRGDIEVRQKNIISRNIIFSITRLSFPHLRPTFRTVLRQSIGSYVFHTPDKAIAIPNDWINSRVPPSLRVTNNFFVPHCPYHGKDIQKGSRLFHCF